MPFEIDFDETSGVINICYRGEVDLGERQAAVEQICSSHHSGRELRILVDVRNMTLNMTIDEQRRFGEYLADCSELKRAKVAILHNKNHNPNIIVDSCAVVNGLHLAQFDLSRDALAWLSGAIR